jgi:metallo-beta-lactamase class B
MPVRVAGKQRVAQFVCGTSAPGYRLVANPGYPMIVRDFRRSFAKLRTIPCDIFLGAHGSYFALDAKRAMLAAGRDGNPFVDPAGCRDHVDRAERRFLDQLAAEQQARGVVSK